LNVITGSCGPFGSTSQGIRFILLPPLENYTTEASNKRKISKRGKTNIDIWKQNVCKRNTVG